MHMEIRHFLGALILMDIGWIWESVLIVLAGSFLLRIAGRKTSAQMTLVEVVIGSLLVEPIINKNIFI